MKVEINFNPADLCLVRETHPAPEAPVVHEEPSTTDPKARQLALAYHIHALIASGEMKDIAHVARVAGVSRARVSQVLDTVLLAPKIQERVIKGVMGVNAHALRRISGFPSWDNQLQSANMQSFNRLGNSKYLETLDSQIYFDTLP